MVPSFYEAGKALKELRDKRLYRSTHHNFESYCQYSFGFSRIAAQYRIAATEVVDNLLTIGYQNSSTDDSLTRIEQILPTTERQVRPLTQLEPDEQVEAWQQAVEANQGKVPPARVVKDIVQRIRERRPVPNPWRVGDVASIIVKENPDLRGRGGCWAIVVDVHDFSCTVQLWDGLHQVRLENLKDLQYTPEQRQQVQALGERLSRISLAGLEKPVRDFLAGLGKLDRPWLTGLEEGMLKFLEGEITADD